MTSCLLDGPEREPLTAPEATPLRTEHARLGPVEVEPALVEQPGAVVLEKGVPVAERRDHQLALAVLRVHVVSEAVGLARGPIAIELDRALPVEVHRRLVRVEVLEDRRERFP